MSYMIDNELVRISYVYVFERNWDSRRNDRAYKAIRRRRDLLIELVRARNLYDRKTGPRVLETSIKIVRSTFFRYSKINTIARCRQVSRLFRPFVLSGNSRTVCVLFLVAGSVGSGLSKKGLFEDSCRLIFTWELLEEASSGIVGISNDGNRRMAVPANHRKKRRIISQPVGFLLHSEWNSSDASLGCVRRFITNVEEQALIGSIVRVWSLRCFASIIPSNIEP